MTTLLYLNSQRQDPIRIPAYDRWLRPDGDVSALFYRQKGSVLVRFPEQADFVIELETLIVSCHPAPGVSSEVIDSLFVNSISPLIANHKGELNLHGSAVSCMGQGTAFIGVSGLGKTTLAAAFANAGHAFIAEDIIDIREANEAYKLHPGRPILRLFQDSAALVLGEGERANCNFSGGKLIIQAGQKLPYAECESPLTALFFLGEEDTSSCLIAKLSPATALSKLCQNTFILDVEDRQRFASHFERLADLAARVPCYTLNYRRDFQSLPDVINSVIETIRGFSQ